MFVKCQVREFINFCYCCRSGAAACFSAAGALPAGADGLGDDQATGQQPHVPQVRPAAEVALAAR